MGKGTGKVLRKDRKAEERVSLTICPVVLVTTDGKGDRKGVKEI
jgi:hypothetical protein